MIFFVLLLYGIWNVCVWVGLLVWCLCVCGFQVYVFGYFLVFGGFDVVVFQLLEWLVDVGLLLLVGYSLGGLLVLEVLWCNLQLLVQWVVCLGLLLCGSGIVCLLFEYGWGLVLGCSSELLFDGLLDWQGRVEVGLIVGLVLYGLGSLLGVIDDVFDGIVVLVEIWLLGLVDYCVVCISYSGLVVLFDVVWQIVYFLCYGKFDYSCDVVVVQGQGGRVVLQSWVYVWLYLVGFMELGIGLVL